MLNVKDVLSNILETGTEKDLINFSRSIFPPPSQEVSEHSYNLIDDTISKLTLCHLTLIEHGFIDSRLSPKYNYEKVSDFLSTLRNQFKTVTKYMEMGFAQYIYFEIAPQSISFLNRIDLQNFSDRIFIAPNFELVEDVIHNQIVSSNINNELDLYTEALDSLETTRRYFKSARNGLWSYELEWSDLQIGFLDTTIDRIKNKILKLSSRDTRKTLLWNQDKSYVLPKLFNLLSGTMIDLETTQRQFEDVFNGTPLTNISHKITWEDNLIPAPNRGIPTLSTLMNWLQVNELIIKQFNLDKEILHTMRHCFLDNNKNPVKRKEPIGNLRAPKHEEFQNMLNELLEA